MSSQVISLSQTWISDTGKMPYPMVSDEGKAIPTIDDIDLSVPQAQSIIIAFQEAYRSHPPSFVLSTVLLLIGLADILMFLESSIYFFHPYIALGFMVAGIGMLSTMYVANK